MMSDKVWGGFAAAKTLFCWINQQTILYASANHSKVPGVLPLNLWSKTKGCISGLFSLSWMQMRQRGENIGSDQTLKRTRRSSAWLISTTRLSTFPLTSMMAVSTYTHSNPSGNHGYSWHFNPLWNVVYRFCFLQTYLQLNKDFFKSEMA